MPYAPNTDYDPRLLQQGFRDLGAGLGKLKAAQEENEFFTQRLEDFSKLKDAAGQPLMDAETAEKYVKGSLSQKKALFADTMFKYTNGLKQQDMGFEQQRINIAGQQAATAANLGDRRVNLDEREFQQKTMDRNSPMRVEQAGGVNFARVPGSANAFPLDSGGAVQPDGTIAKDADNNEIGVWMGGKLIQDSYKPMWQGSTQILINQRTGNPKVERSAAPGGTANNALLPNLSAMDQQAAEWAKANPQDPRAAKIRKRLGLQ